MSGYHNLDNEEVMFVYLTNKKFLSGYQNIFEKGGVESVLDLSETAYVVGFKAFSEDDISDLRNDNHYLYCVSVHEKLKPIVELIRGELPELYDKVKQSFGKVE